MADPSLALGSLVTAAPLVALTALTLYGVNILRYRECLNIRELWRLGAAATAGVPVGIWMVANANEAFVKGLLGFILIGYGLYALTRQARSGHVRRAGRS
jgi:uncharacterized membrane protein YfcA